MQPYEAHLSYFMHFYGDYNLSGMDFVKITDFHIRHLETFEDHMKSQIQSSKSFYQFDKFNTASLLKDQDSDLIEVKSGDSMSSQGQFPGFKTQKDDRTYEFLQNDNYLRLWHADMPEVKDITEQVISPYNRSSSSAIEVDCSCKDILNIWESDQNIVGGSSAMQDPRNSDLYKRSQDSHVDESFLDNYITPFKTPIPRDSIRQSIPPQQQNSEFQIPRGLESQQSFRTVSNDQQDMMKIQIDPLNRQRTENQVKEFSQSQLGRLNSLRQSSCQSFKLQSEDSYHLAQPVQGLQTPKFREEAKSEQSYDREFTKYSEDIREVRSLVNLWREEFIRRKTNPNLPPLEKAVMSDPNRQFGYSQNQINKEIVKNQLKKHLKTKCAEVDYSGVNNELYKQLDPIMFQTLKVYLQQKEYDQGDDGGLERFQMLGFGTMRQLHDARHGKAVVKNLQQQMTGDDEQDTEQAVDNNEINVDVLDIMDSLKDQFEGLQLKYQSHRDGKSKYRTGKLATDINNNKSIFDYMSPKSKQKESKLLTIEEEKSGDELTNQKQSNRENSITLTDLELLDDGSTLQLLDLQDALQSEYLQTHVNPLPLEEVKEEQSCDENSYLSEIQSLLSEDQLKQETPPQPQPQLRHVLRADKIDRIRSPRRPQADDIRHQRAFFSRKDDLITHLNEVRRIRNNKKLQLKDLKVDLHEVNKNEIELDIRLLKDSHMYQKVAENTFTYKLMAPLSSVIRQKYSQREQKIQYERRLCNFDVEPTQTKIADKDKKLIKKEMVLEAKKDHRFVTPATQYDLRFLDSQVNVGGFEKRRDQLNDSGAKMSLYDIHKEFDEIFGLTVIVLEVMVCTRPGMVPNYEIDPITAVYFTIHNESAEVNLRGKYQLLNGVIINKAFLRSLENFKLGAYHPLTEVIYARNEINLMQRVIDVFREYDPDIIVGYETETQSIGYICKRGETLQIQMASMLSRTPVSIKPLNESFYNQRLLIKNQEIGSVDDHLPGQPLRDTKKNKNSYFQQKWGQAVKLSGRVIINLWRLIKSEINLTNYDLDNICFHILKKREPRFDYDTLTNWWQKGQYYHLTNATLKKLHNMLQIIDTMNFIHRDINMANVYGIDYESVMTRGSQFRVEAILSRITKSQGFILLSASPKQVFEQQELEVIPLVIEPDKLFYTDPVIIVDFQSLYPSIIIAYNLCYSTCLGKLVSINQDAYSPTRRLGVYVIPASMKTFFGFKADQDLTEEQEQHIMDNIIIAPNLNCFVKPHLRQGILPLMLREILYTRIMVKKSMKLYEPGSTTYRMLDSRQLALKLIANVTYGYTAAGFSGRMPCCELADSVVSLGRMTVENAISLINQQEDTQGTRVIYGDTDSIFILCQGQSLEQTFQIGDQIAKHITSINPFPMELKFEKVYYPCVTLAKKRYCGYKMEKLNDERVLDAKGIETIRRDTVDAVQKIMDKALRLLFTNKDLSQIKEYLIRQWSKIQQGQVDFKDFIFAKEVKYGMYRSMPPGAIVVERRLQTDPGAMPRYHERIPYVVVMGQGGAIDQSKIKDLVLSPEEFLSRDGLMLNAPYYIQKQINPALNRIFLEIFDIDVNNWYDKMPKKLREQGTQSKKVSYFTNKINSSKSVISLSKISSTSSIAGQNSMMIDQFYQRKCCLVCGSDDLLNNTKQICKNCVNNMRSTYFIMQSRLKNVETTMERINHTCLACSNMLLNGRVASMIDIEDSAGALNVVPCLAYQCTVFHQKLAAFKEYQSLKEVMKKLHLDII